MDYTRKAVRRAISFFGNIFSSARNTLVNLYRGKTRHHRRHRNSVSRNMKTAVKNMQEETMPANGPPPPKNGPAGPAMQNTSMPLAPAPQSAGKKMRAKNLRGMKFYKATRRIRR